MAKTVVAALVALCILARPLCEALAHGGGLDSSGCHRETATGGYHCHRGGSDDDEPDWETAGYVLGGLLVVGLVIYWCRQDNASWLAPADEPLLGDNLDLVVRIGDAVDDDHQGHQSSPYMGLSYKVRF